MANVRANDVQNHLDKVSGAIYGAPGHLQVRGGATSTSWHAVKTSPGDDIPLTEIRMSPLLGLRELIVWVKGYVAGIEWVREEQASASKADPDFEVKSD